LFSSNSCSCLRGETIAPWFPAVQEGWKHDHQAHASNVCPLQVDKESKPHWLCWS
jgi:hypothetical protein